MRNAGAEAEVAAGPGRESWWLTGQAACTGQYQLPDYLGTMAITAETSCQQGLSAPEQQAPGLRAGWTLGPQVLDGPGEAQTLGVTEKGWDGQSPAPAA